VLYVYSFQVGCLLGLAGACRQCELTNLTTDDVVLKGGHLFVNLEDTKNYKPRVFAIVESAVTIIKKVRNLETTKYTS